MPNLENTPAWAKSQINTQYANSEPNVMSGDAWISRALATVNGNIKNAQDVFIIQNALTALGFKPGKIDSLYGPSTASAVRAFQKDARITESGLGKETIATLKLAVEARVASGNVAVDADRRATERDSYVSEMSRMNKRSKEMQKSEPKEQKEAKIALVTSMQSVFL